MIIIVQEARVDELEVQLESAQADLKSAHKRIDQLHGALKDHEEEYTGDEEDEEANYTSGHLDSLDSSVDSYSMGDDDSLGFSGDDDEEIVMPKTTRSLDRNRLRSREPVATAALEKKRSSRDDLEDDEFEASRKARQLRLKELDDDEFEASRKARSDRLKDIDDDDVSGKGKHKVADGKDKVVQSSKTSSSKYTKKAFDEDEDDDDDDDLEEFLRRQRERMKKMEKDEDDEDDDEDDKRSTLKGSRGLSSRNDEDDSALRGSRRAEDMPSGKARVSNGKSNGIHSSSSKSASREASEEPSPAHRKISAEDGEGHVASRYRRKRQRRRTIEQLTSPEHLSAKANGVD